MTAFQFTFNADGAEFSARLDEDRKSLANRIRSGLEKTARQDVLDPLRAQTKAALKSKKLPTTWRLLIFPKEERHTLTPAALVVSRAPAIISAFEEGANILPLNGKRFLWIPTAAVPTSTGGKKLSVKDMIAKVGKFRLVPGKRGSWVALAFVKAGNKRSRRKGGAATKTLSKAAPGKGEETAIFILVPQVTLRKRLDVKGVVDRARSTFTQNLEQAVAQER